MDILSKHHQGIPSFSGVGSMIQQVVDMCHLKASATNPTTTSQNSQTTTNNPNNGPFPFLRLPRELRDQIYSYLFEPVDLITAWTEGAKLSHDQKITGPSILNCNHQLRDEFLCLFFMKATVQIDSVSRIASVRQTMPSSLNVYARKVNFLEHKFRWSDWELQCKMTLSRIAELPNLRSISIRWHHWGVDPVLNPIFEQMWAKSPLRQVSQLKRFELTRGDLIGFSFRFLVCNEQTQHLLEIDYPQGRRVEWEDRVVRRWRGDDLETTILDMNGFIKDKQMGKLAWVTKNDSLYIRLP